MKRTICMKSTNVIREYLYDGHFECDGGTTAIFGNLRRFSTELTYKMQEFALWTSFRVTFRVMGYFPGYRRFLCYAREATE